MPARAGIPVSANSKLVQESMPVSTEHVVFGRHPYLISWVQAARHQPADHLFAVGLLPNVMPARGLADFEPAALVRVPHDRGLEYLDPATGWFRLHRITPANNLDPVESRN